MIIIGILLLLKYNDTFRRTFWYFMQLFAILGIGLIWCALIFPVLLLRQRRFENILIFALFAKPVTSLIGIRYEIRNEENMPADGTCAVVVSNNPSKLVFLSILYMINNLKVLCALIVDVSNVSWLGPFGWVLHYCGCCFTKRTSDLRNTEEEIDRLANTAFEEKTKMWFFPQGNAFEEASPQSAFRIAIDRKVPIIPIVFSPHSFFDWNNLRAEEGKVIIDILSPISTVEYKRENVNSLIEKTQALITRKHEELAEEIRRERHAHAE